MNHTVNTLQEALDRLKNPTESTLTWIHLGDNRINDQDAIALASAIRHSVAPINFINLDGNKIGDEGAIALASSIKHSVAPIREIYLDRNQIGDRGAVAFASLIMDWVKPIRTIGLSNNQIGDEGAIVIETSLYYNDTITYCGLKYNNVPNSRRRNINKLCEDTSERRAAVIAMRQRLFPQVDLVDDTEDDEDVDMSDIYLSVEI